ncbi:MAG: hypothetical protein IT441_02565 [Phycisphaeraceae bacterium]|nr:hypothetical protein [Phycisphaeraceae bacterium]
MVHFVDGLIRHKGKTCVGLCDNDAHEIHVARCGSEAQQTQVIFHEYMHAWVYHFGPTMMMDEERICDLFGLAMTQFVRDLSIGTIPMRRVRLPMTR